jgi:hypothetical protein
MTMFAKFAGLCTACAGRIVRGDQIEWRKGQGARHVCCNAPAKDAPVSGHVWAYANPTEARNSLVAAGVEGPVGFRAWGNVAVRQWTFDPATERIEEIGKPPQQMRRPSSEDYACSDMGYEDRCAEACGLR